MPFRIPVPRVLGLLVLAVLAACGSGPTQLSTDTYLLHRRADSGQFFADLPAVKAELAREAEAFAQSRGQMVVPVASRMTDAEIARPARYEYEFRLVDKPGAAPRTAAAAPAASPSAGAAPAATTAAAAAPAPAPAPAPARPGMSAEQAKAMHDDLLRFDELRKRGVITEAEFAEIKRRLIGN